MTGLSVGRPRRVGAALIIPLVEQRTQTLGIANAFWVQGELAAVAVVVKTAGGVQAFSVDGEEQDSRSLAAAVPALGRLLAFEDE